MGDIEEDLMMSALIAAGTDRHSARIVTNTVCALKTGPTCLEVYGRGHVMAAPMDLGELSMSTA